MFATRKRTEIFTEFAGGLPKNVGGSCQYLYCLNGVSQTVSVIDCATDTVTATITLTAAKTFSALFYRPVDMSVYVLGVSYFDRIDADPASGTFNTIVQSGATQIASPTKHCYIAWPIDALAGAGAPRWVRVQDLNASAESLKYQWVSSDGQYANLPIFGHGTSDNARLHPLSALIEVTSTGGTIGPMFYKVYANTIKQDGVFDGNFRLERVGIPTDLGQTMKATYKFRNFNVLITNNSIYAVHSQYELSNLLYTVSTGLGSNSLYFLEYDPVNKILMVGFGTSVSGGSNIKAINVGNKIFTDAGTMTRTVATNENCTGDILFNPYNNKVYVQGKSHGGNPVGVDKIHVFDLASSLVSSGSITVGNMGAPERSGNYALNALCMNGQRYWESNDAI